MSSSEIVQIRSGPGGSLELNTRFYPLPLIEAAAREFSEAAPVTLADAGPDRVRLTFQGPPDTGRAFANRVLALVREGQ